MSVDFRVVCTKYPVALLKKKGILKLLNAQVANAQRATVASSSYPKVVMYSIIPFGELIASVATPLVQR